MKEHMHPLLMKDMYKAFHVFATKPGVEYNYSNLTPRFGKHSNTDLGGVVVWGIQYFLLEHLMLSFNEKFFNVPKEEAVDEYREVIQGALMQDIDTSHIEALHDLQYLPLEVKALPEGTFVPYGVPLLTMKNTHPDFPWLVGALEDVTSAYIWPMSTSATTALAYRLRFERSALDKAMIPFMGHDFSLRGMVGIEAGAMVGSGHLLSFMGSDNIPAAILLRNYYEGDIEGAYAGRDVAPVFTSVNATEHSVMCSYGQDDELESIRHIIQDVAPTGIVSLVCDAWDFWKVVTEYLPQLKDVIMAREGTVVIRPDSGDPVDIVCGRKDTMMASNGKHYALKDWTCDGGGYDMLRDETKNLTEVPECEVKGLVECLWDTFGGTINEQGLKVLDSHIGAIYGDSITLDRQDKILTKLQNKGFVPSVVLGIGSYTYQYVTRDTHGFAMKATAMKFKGDENWTPIFKQPKTDSAKNSAKGLMMVKSFNDGAMYEVVQDVYPIAEAAGALQTVFLNGELEKLTNLVEVRANLDKVIKHKLGV